MPFPDIIQTAHDHLFDDIDELRRARLPEATINHLLRLREVYSYWLETPSLSDTAIVKELRTRGGIGPTQARKDLRILKTLLGSLNRVSKDWQRYRHTCMIEEAYELARTQESPRDMIAAAAQLAKAARLDQPDDTRDYSDVALQSFTFTDDPTAAGFARVENFRELIRKKKSEMWTDEVVDVSFEEIDFSVDDLFNPDKKTDDDTPLGLPQ